MPFDVRLYEVLLTGQYHSYVSSVTVGSSLGDDRTRFIETPAHAAVLPVRLSRESEGGGLTCRGQDGWHYLAVEVGEEHMRSCDEW